MSRYEDLKELANNISFATRERNPGVNDLPPRTDSHMDTDANTKYFRMTNPKPTKQRNYPEKDLEQFVHDTARACGLLYYHTYRSRFSEKGFPDCIIIGRWVLVVELKATGKNPTPAQEKWLHAFERQGARIRVWRPEDKDEILKFLAYMRVV